MDGRERVMVAGVGFVVGIRCQRVLKSVWCNIAQHQFLFQSVWTDNLHNSVGGMASFAIVQCGIRPFLASIVAAAAQCDSYADGSNYHHSICQPTTLKYLNTSWFWASFFINIFFKRLSGISKIKMAEDCSYLITMTLYIIIYTLCILTSSRTP